MSPETSKYSKITTDKQLIVINQQSVVKDETPVNMKANSMTAYRKKMNLLRSKYKTEQLRVVDGQITEFDAKDLNLGSFSKKKRLDYQKHTSDL